MGDLVALRCVSVEEADAAASCLNRVVGRGVVSALAVAVVSVDRRARCHVRHGFAAEQQARRSWACWMIMSVAVWAGGMVDVGVNQPGVELPERIDEPTIAMVAARLGLGEAALVVTLAEPTPLLLIEAVRRHVEALLWSTLCGTDRELVSTVLRASPRA